ncbi:hypothetical protein [Moraxella caviae]|uniref:hypothetical protein n=1 Tax=Moraxella caviae TaxID=34060 RepID=UPI00117CC9E3|nr:hypothetical protein [Moraxella caviae]
MHSITANPKMSLWLYVKSFLVSVLLVLVALFFHDVFTSTSIYDRTQSGYFSSLTYNLVKVFAFPLTTFVWIVMCCGYYKGRQNYQFMQRAGIKDEAKPSKNQSEQQNKPS